jgi:hypothetical protein
VIGRGLAKSLIDKIPGRALIEINKRVGFRLLTKAGEKGAVNVMKGLPVVGGLIGGTVDAAACRIVGKNAKKLFGRSKRIRRMRPKGKEPSTKVIVVPAVRTRPNKRDQEVYGRILSTIKEAGDNGISYVDLVRKTGSQHATLKTFVARNPDKVNATRVGHKWKLIAR